MFADTVSFKHMCCYVFIFTWICFHVQKGTHLALSAAEFIVVSTCVCWSERWAWWPLGFSILSAESGHHVHFCFLFVSWPSQITETQVSAYFPFCLDFITTSQCFFVFFPHIIHHYCKTAQCLSATLPKLLVLKDWC